MSFHYIEKYIYAIDENDNLCCLLLKIFTSLACAYDSTILAKDKKYRIYYDVANDTESITGEKIDIPTSSEWQDMLNGNTSKPVNDLLNLHELNPEAIMGIITVTLYGSGDYPFTYTTELISKNGIQYSDGNVIGKYFDESPVDDNMWTKFADKMSQNILSNIKNSR